MAKARGWILFPILSISSVSLVVFVVMLRFSGNLPRQSLHFPISSSLEDPSPRSPRIAYFISGSDGDGDRIMRLLLAVYHPINYYLLNLDLRASQRQRERLVSAVLSVDSFAVAGNVDVVGQSGYSNPEGASSLATLLHGAAVLLWHCNDWDWFVNLAASDYPLITQDDFLHVLSFLPRNLNFIQHSDKIGSLESQRMRSVVVDPGLYLAPRRDIFHATQKRSLPTSFRFSTGSPFFMLSRKFVEFAILGWENLPRALLLYFTNTKNPTLGYFQSLAANSREFCDTLVGSDLRFVGDSDSDSESDLDSDSLLGGGAAFAGGFRRGDRRLDWIDGSVLSRRWGRVAPGGWCLGSDTWWSDKCATWGDARILRPGPGARRFERYLLRFMTTNDSSVWTGFCLSDVDASL
ncbi:beta-glucuronosyltransferase GlcAT14A-like [Wolffia australiana]